MALISTFVWCNEWFALVLGGIRNCGPYPAQKWGEALIAFDKVLIRAIHPTVVGINHLPILMRINKKR